jgi:hypothetical protein
MVAKSSPTPATAERRVAPRFQPAFATICRLRPADGSPFAGLVWNISETGLSMLTTNRPKVGEDLAAELEAEAGGTTVALGLRVVHATPVPTGDCLVGARFDRPLTEAELQHFVTPPETAKAVSAGLLEGWKPPKKG